MQFFSNANFDFLSKRKVAFAISGLVILAGIVSFFVRGGLNLSIDFKGGTLLQVEFTEAVAIDDIRESLRNIGLGSAEVQPFGSPKDVVVRVKEGDRDGVSLSTKIKETLSKDFKVKEYRREEMVGPKIGSELRDKAMLAILWSMVGIMFYISWRFGAQMMKGLLLSMGIIMGVLLLDLLVKWIDFPQSIMVTIVFVAFLYLCWKAHLRYSLAAIVALLHDVLITLGIFSILNKELSLTIVAAVLTIIGYSLNDTIVVFDRIRENLRSLRKQSYNEVLNASINQTLSRTIITSLTTLFVLITLAVFGGAVIMDFALAMIIGVVSGTYSSIFVASPVLSVWNDYDAKKKKEALVSRKK